MYLPDLPVELHLNIYYLMNDTIDALSLSRTSKQFRKVFQENRRLLLKTIIVLYICSPAVYLSGLSHSQALAYTNTSF